MARPSCPMPHTATRRAQSSVEGHGSAASSRSDRGGHVRVGEARASLGGQQVARTSASDTTARARSARARRPPASPATAGQLGEDPDGRGRLAALPDALERLVLVAHQGGEPGDLIRIGEHVARR